MKQIDIIKTYSQKQCLVVDDVPDIRTALKRILIDYGAADVETAGSAEEAIELCQRTQYDIVLADLNLGTGKSGQQLLEELRFNRLLLNASLFVMITAESSSQYVLHTLEYQPDDYLSKPITRDALRPRLDQALLKNEALKPIKKALDLQKPQKAIAACQDLLNTKSKYKNDIKRIYGTLLIQQNMLDEAIENYHSIDDERRPLWAQIGLAEALFKNEDLEAAKKLLNEVINQQQHCVEAHDLMARIFEKEKNLDLAQHELSIAIQLSPLSVDRQREMGRVSRENNDFNASVNAFRSALKHSKNSCHETPNDYINLADSLTSLSTQDSSKLANNSEEALDSLRQLDKKYGKQPIYKIRSKLLEADIYDIQGKPDIAQKACEEAAQVHAGIKLTVIANTPSNTSLEVAKALMARGMYDEGELLLQELAKTTTDAKLSVQIDKLLREPLTREGILFAAKENKLGITLYQNKNYAAALDAFTKVLDDIPNHIGLNLNLIQAAVSVSKENGLNDDITKIIDNSFQRIGQLNDNSSYMERYRYLCKQFNKLKEKTC